MITPKIDWTSDTYFNIEDYERIVVNLNSLATLYAIPEIIMEDISYSSAYTIDIFDSIRLIYNKLLLLVGSDLPPISSRGFYNMVWLNFEELNNIESLINEVNITDIAVYSASGNYGENLLYGGIYL